MTGLKVKTCFVDFGRKAKTFLTHQFFCRCYAISGILSHIYDKYKAFAYGNRLFSKKLLWIDGYCGMAKNERTLNRMSAGNSN